MTSLPPNEPANTLGTIIAIAVLMGLGIAVWMGYFIKPKSQIAPNYFDFECLTDDKRTFRYEESYEKFIFINIKTGEIKDAIRTEKGYKNPFNEYAKFKWCG